MQPLNALKSKKKKSMWSKECDEAFEKVKQLLSLADVLVHYNTKKELTMAVDASPHGVSAVISHQEDDKGEQPIAYASRTLTKAEQNYSQLEREKHWQLYLACKNFICKAIYNVDQQKINIPNSWSHFGSI